MAVAGRRAPINFLRPFPASPHPSPSPQWLAGDYHRRFLSFERGVYFRFEETWFSKRTKEKNEVETEKIRKYGGSREEVTRNAWLSLVATNEHRQQASPPPLPLLPSSVNPSERFTPDVREVRKRNGSFERGREMEENEGRKIGE